jgi:hypothetical protein
MSDITKKDGPTGVPYPGEVNYWYNKTEDMKMNEQARGIQHSGAETQLVLVECIHQYRMRYVVEVPFGHSDWALDTVTMEEAKEFSQLSLGETIISHRIVSRDEVLKLCDEDNDYCHSWTDEAKLDAFVTFDNEDLMEF